MFATILVGIIVICVVLAVILVVFASIGMVIAVLAKNKGPEFEIFFKNSKKVFFSCFQQISCILLKDNVSNFTNCSSFADILSQTL